jgi:hypothetical protein
MDVQSGSPIVDWRKPIKASDFVTALEKCRAFGC